MIVGSRKPMPHELWPEQDQEAWRFSMNADPLAEAGGGGGAKWRPSTRRFIETGYGRWLGWLDETGRLDRQAAPFARATRETVRSYLDALEAEGYADYSRAGRFQALADALRVMGGTGVEFIRRAAGRIAGRARRVRDLHGRLRPPREVLDYGLELMEFGTDERQPNFWKRALDYRDGLLIALWTMRPLRMANLSTIQLGRQLVAQAGGHRLSFPAAEMKSKRSFTCVWPDALNQPLLTYLEVHRPVLAERSAGADPGHLWLSGTGRAMSPATVAQMIRIRTASKFGAAITPHLMRHIAATSIAEDEPRLVMDAAAILGHASLEPTEKHYILASGFSAASHFQSFLVSRMRAERR